MPVYPQTVLDDLDAIRAQLRDLNTRLASIPSDATAAPWLAAASLGAGWTDMQATDSTVDAIGFQVRPGAWVRARGTVIRSGSAWPAAGFTLVTLPASALPTKKQFALMGSPFGNGWAFADILTTGAVRIWGWGGGTTGAAGTGISLDGLTYRLA